MFVFIQERLDKIRNVLVSDQRLIRRISRKDFREVRLHEKERKQYLEFAKSVRAQHADESYKFLKGYLLLLENDLAGYYKELHDILVLDMRLANEIRAMDAAVAMKIRDAEAEIEKINREKGQHPPGNLQHLKDLINTTFMLTVEMFEGNINQMIVNIVGMDSLTISTFKLLDRESQFREVAQEFKNIRGDDQKVQKEFKALSTFALGQVESLDAGRDTQYTKQFKELFSQDPKKSRVNIALKEMITDLLKATQNTIILINETYNEFDAISQSDAFINRSLTDIPEKDEEKNLEHPVSLTALGLPRTETGGGLGYPKDKHYNELVEICRRIRVNHKDQLHLIVQEARNVMSQGERLIEKL